LEPLILEIKTPGLYRYHVLDKSELSIGRALDNDIILSDPTVEPYHLRILRDNEGQLELQNLAKVNPAKFDNPQQDKFTSAMLPIEFDLGRISARILSRNHRVEATKFLASGDGRMKHLYGHWGWAALLLMLCFLTSGLEFYFNSYNTLKWDELLNFVFRESVLSIAAFVFSLSILERLLVNRWEIKPVIISVALIYLTYQLLSLLVVELMYLFSSDTPASIFNLAWYLLIVPAAVSIYLIRITHFGQRKGILLATLISSPFAILAIMQNPTLDSFLDDFSSSANYQKSLSPLNWHLSQRVSIDAFIGDAAKLEPGEFSD
jgi:hypothetical protein